MAGGIMELITTPTKEPKLCVFCAKINCTPSTCKARNNKEINNGTK